MKSWQVAALHMDNLSFQQVSGGKANNYFSKWVNFLILSPTLGLCAYCPSVPDQVMPGSSLVIALACPLNLIAMGS